MKVLRWLTYRKNLVYGNQQNRSRDMCLTWGGWETILDIIVKNIRYLLLNRCAWHSFHNANKTIWGQDIRCINDLCDSWRLTDVNPHFIPLPGTDTISKLRVINLLWRHRFMSRSLALMTSQWPRFPWVSMNAWRWSRWIKEIVIICGAVNWQVTSYTFCVS